MEITIENSHASVVVFDLQFKLLNRSSKLQLSTRAGGSLDAKKSQSGTVQSKKHNFRMQCLVVMPFPLLFDCGNNKAGDWKCFSIEYNFDDAQDVLIFDGIVGIIIFMLLAVRT